MNPGCCWCKNYNQLSWLERTSELNVSGKKVWYRRWSKHRCEINQEDKYPRDCDFEIDEKHLKSVQNANPDLPRLIWNKEKKNWEDDYNYNENLCVNTFEINEEKINPALYIRRDNTYYIKGSNDG